MGEKKKASCDDFDYAPLVVNYMNEHQINVNKKNTGTFGKEWSVSSMKQNEVVSKSVLLKGAQKQSESPTYSISIVISCGLAPVCTH